MAVLFFRDTDPGAPRLSGEAGRLLEVFESCLIVNRVFTTDDTTFTDQTAAARNFNDAAFGLFPAPSLSSAAYFGMSVQFPQIELVLDTVATGGRFQWEYWGGSWKLLSVVDGTNGLTRSGMVTWTPPSDWATVAVNGVTLYWVRVRPLELPSVYPTCKLASVLRWAIYYTGANIRSYRMGEGTRFYLQMVDDGVVSAGGAREAVARGYEDMTGVTTGVRPFPTVTQATKGLFIRKSGSLDATARPWVLVGDERTFYFVARPEAGQDVWQSFGFGDIFSFSPANQYDCIIVGKLSENSSFEETGSGGLSQGAKELNERVNGWYLARSYTGSEGAVPASNVSPLTDRTVLGLVLYPNPTDGGVYVQPVFVTEPDASALRGIARGFWGWCHWETAIPSPTVALVDGAGDLAGKRFALVKRAGTYHRDHGAVPTVFVFEVSSTWPKN
jgi:hypothetical protein